MSTAVRASETEDMLMLQDGATARDRERFESVRARVHEQIRALQARLAESVAAAAAPSGAAADDRLRAERKLRLLKQLERELPELYPQELPSDSAGLGSMLTLEDCVTGEHLEYILMSGDDIDVAAGQVSLGSPVGQAVLGLRPGAAVDVMLPRGKRTFRIAALTTLPALLGLEPLPGTPKPPRRSRARAPRGAASRALR